MSEEDLERTVATMIYPRSWAPDAPDNAGVRSDRAASLEKARKIIEVVRLAPVRLV